MRTIVGDSSNLFIPTNSIRYVTHEEKVEFLDAFAVLIGCREYYGASLPDGYRPDVLRVDTQGGVLFIGDAKNTENPRCLQTQVRLQRYLRWLAVYMERAPSTGIFALCFGKATDARGWVETINLLAYEIGLTFDTPKVQRFGPELFILLFVSSSGTTVFC